MASMTRNLVHIEPSSSTSTPSQGGPDSYASPPFPEKVASRSHTHRRHDPDVVELQNLPDDRASGRSSPPREDVQRDLEMSRSNTPDAAVEVLPSVWNPFMNRFRLLSVCLANLGNGLSDSAAGALIPYMEKYYNIEYGVVSLIFVGQALGFVFAAVVIDAVRAKFGRAKAVGIGQVALICGYIPLVCNAPWVVNVLSFFLVGYGIATTVAMGNIFCGGLQSATVHLGLMHGCYGIGGTMGPLIATALVTAVGAGWSTYYLLTLGLGVVNLALTVWSFWHFERDQSPRMREAETSASDSILVGMLGAVKLRLVIIGAVFYFAYQGAEVSISGWITSFLIHARGGDPSSVGYVSAGFWGGITVGRFLLSGLAQRFGEKRVVYIFVGGSVVFEVLVWAVPNIITNAVAVSIVGLLQGPIYPAAAAVLMRNMSKRDALSGMTVTSACGSLGGAVAPFVTGLLAQAVGTFILHPVVIFLSIIMIICWKFLSTSGKKIE